MCGKLEKFGKKTVTLRMKHECIFKKETFIDLSRMWDDWGKEQEKVPDGGIRKLLSWSQRRGRYMEISLRSGQRISSVNMGEAIYVRKIVLKWTVRKRISKELSANKMCRSCVSIRKTRKQFYEEVIKDILLNFSKEQETNLNFLGGKEWDWEERGLQVLVGIRCWRYERIWKVWFQLG